MIDANALRDEIESGPLAATLDPLVAAGNDAGVAAALNAKAFPGPVPIVEVSAFFINEGVTGTVKVTLDDPATPAQVRFLCHLVLTLIETDYRLTSCDTSAAKFAEVTGGMVALGLMTEGQVNALVGLSANRRSRAEVVFGDGVSVGQDDVSFAMRGMR